MCAQPQRSKSCQRHFVKFAIALPHRSRRLPEGAGRPVTGSSPAVPQRTAEGERPTRPAPTRVRAPRPVGATMLTHAAALAGRARPGARPLLCTGSGAAGRRLHPPASALRRSSRRSSAAVPGRRERAASARAHAAPSAAVPGRFRSPQRHRPARPAPTLSEAERAPLETRVRCTSRCAERWDPAGAKSRENGLGFFFRPRPLRPLRATPAPAAGARCGDVTAGARAALLQVRRAAGARGLRGARDSRRAWGTRRVPTGFREVSLGCPALFHPKT